MNNDAYEVKHGLMRNMMRHPNNIKKWLNLKAAHKKSTTEAKGFALAAVMMILVVTAIISTTAIKTGLLNENLAQSQNQIEQAKQNADLTLKDAMNNILCRFEDNGAGTSTTVIANQNFFTGRDAFDHVPTGQCQQGLCGDNLPNQPVWQTLHQNTPAVEFARYGQFTGSNLINPNLGRYLIEAVQLNFPDGNGNTGDGTQQAPFYQYRITAVGISEQNPRVYEKLQIILHPQYRKCGYNAVSNSFQ